MPSTPADVTHDRPTQVGLLVVTNSSAGTNDQENIDAAVAVLRTEREVEVASTSSPDELDEVLARREGRTVVVAGGDGSLHAVLAALHRNADLDAHGRPGPILGLLPLGTGNDFARAHGLPLDAEAAARIILGSEALPVDLVTDDAGGVVANSVHLGAGAEASEVGARWKEKLGHAGVGKANLGRLGYPIGALATAFAPLGARLRVEVDGKVINSGRERVLMVAVGNGTSVGGGAELTPDALTGDGLVDVMISRAVGGTTRFAYGLDVLRGRHRQRDDVEYLRGRTVTVRSLRPDQPFSVSSDGELESDVRTRTWRVLPGAYRLLLPRSARATVTG